MPMQDNSKLVALNNEQDDILRKYRGGKKPAAVIKRLSDLQFAITAEWNRLSKEQKKCP